MLVTRRSHGVTCVIAHRGDTRVARENTLDAFRMAVEAGADMVELDVRRSADGRLAVVHDPLLADGAPVVATPFARLPPWVPTLDAALDACAGATVDIELKNHADEPGHDPTCTLADDVVAAVLARGELDRVLISSFDLEMVERVRDVCDDVATAWLVEDLPAAGQPDVVGVLVAGRHQALHPRWDVVDAPLVARCHDAGLAVNVWTCDDAAAMARLAAWGVDGICTNRIDLAAAALTGTP
jgi:glycerophosphoryl diester phosphodiesterase